MRYLLSLLYTRHSARYNAIVQRGIANPPISVYLPTHERYAIDASGVLCRIS